jgi:hypothetical protein
VDGLTSERLAAAGLEPDLRPYGARSEVSLIFTGTADV